MSAILLDNDSIHYEVLGRGRPVVFLHGWVGSWRYWIPTMQAASISFRAYAIDLWGFGDSARNSANYTLDSQVALLAQFLERMGIGRIALVGHGLGAAVGVFFAARYGWAVDRLMLASLPRTQGLASLRLQATSSSSLVEWLLGRSEVGTAAEAHKADVLAISQSLADLQAVDLAGAAAGLNKPCLYVHGQGDPVALWPFIDPSTTWRENAHQVVFEQSGHFPMLDEGSKFSRLLVDFLALPPGSSPRQLQLKEEWKRRVR